MVQFWHFYRLILYRTYFHGEADGPMADSLRVRLGQVFDVLEQRLREQPFMAGKASRLVSLAATD